MAFVPMNPLVQVPAQPFGNPFTWFPNETWNGCFAFTRDQSLYGSKNRNEAARRQGDGAGESRGRFGQDECYDGGWVSLLSLPSVASKDPRSARPLNFKLTITYVRKKRLPSLMTKLDGAVQFADVPGAADPAEKGNLRGLTLFLNNTPLPHFSLFDLIGWCMSKAIGAPPAGATKENFYFPLITLFAHWCAVARQPDKADISMVSCTWRAKDRTTAQGIAMRPPTNDAPNGTPAWQVLSPYQPLVAAGLLADPCRNCQKLIEQMLGHQNVLSQFGVEELKKRAGIVKERPGFTGQPA
ncbi:MAG: hypothetical protein Q9227_009295 [Pyrenula ochraceoflavens]